MNNTGVFCFLLDSLEVRPRQPVRIGLVWVCEDERREADIGRPEVVASLAVIRTIIIKSPGPGELPTLVVSHLSKIINSTFR